MTRLVRMMMDTRTHAREMIRDGDLPPLERGATLAVVKVLCAMISFVDELNSGREER